MRDVLTGISPIAAGLALAVIIHRSERRQASGVRREKTTSSLSE